MRFENHEIAGLKQAFWSRMLRIFAAISCCFAALGFVIVYFSVGYPPPASVAEAALLVAGAVAGVLSLVLYGVSRKQAVSTIAVDEAGISLTTTAGHRQVLRWDDRKFRLVLWNRGPSFRSLPSIEDVGVLNAPRAFVAWPTRTARDTLLLAAREHGIKAWTWEPWSLYTIFPTSTLLAHKLSISDRLRGLKSARSDS